MAHPRKPTMADVARLAGVSPMTVSRALKANTSVNAATRRAVQAAAEQLGYVVDNAASALSSRRSGFVAMTIPEINDTNFAETARGLTEGLRESSLEVMLGFTSYDPAEEERLVEAFLRRRPEAFVVTGGNHTERCRTLLRNTGVPVVETWDMPQDPVDRVVGFSNAECGAAAAQHFRDAGFERIGFIGSDVHHDPHSAERARGFQAVLEKYRLVSGRMICDTRPPFAMREGAEAMERLLSNWPDTEAVMCGSDLAAFGALNAALARDMRVPEDIAIAGFGAYELAEFATPALTTIDVQAERIGTEAAALIVEALSDPGAGPEPVNIPITLRARASTQRAARPAAPKRAPAKTDAPPRATRFWDV